MKYAIGVFISFIGFYLASEHLGQTIKEYWDFVAFFVVVFGSLSVLIISQPAASLKVLFKLFIKKLFIPSPKLKTTVNQCWEISQSRKPIHEPKFIEEHLLNDGLELRSLGFNKEKIQEILVQRFSLHEKNIHLISAWLRRNAKYPPAFGLAGTVLGLIHLMRGISTGIDTKETGLRMAVALVATFYGLLISNLVLNPLGEWLIEELKKDEMKAEISIETISLILDEANMVEIQEKLNSYLDSSERISGLQMNLEAEVA